MALPTPPISPGANSVLNRAIPGLPNLTTSASNLVGSLLGGQPGTSKARSANAYFGATSGVPGSEFVRGRGFDLYNREGEQRQQQGFQDLLAMISGYGQPALQERGQNIQQSQFGQSLAQQQAEFAARLKAQQDQFNAQHNLELQKFGFDQNRYSGGGGGSTQAQWHDVPVRDPESAFSGTRTTHWY